MDKFFNKIDVLKGYNIVIYLHRLYIMVTAVSRRSIIYQAGCLYKSCLEMMSRRDNSVNIKHWYTVIHCDTLIQSRKLWRYGISSIIAVIPVNFAECMMHALSLVWEIFCCFQQRQTSIPMSIWMYAQWRLVGVTSTEKESNRFTNTNNNGHSSMYLSLKKA